MSDLEKVRPYAHMPDAELEKLAEMAAEIRIREAMLTPRQIYKTLLEHGCPKRSALRMITASGLRLFAARFQLDCEDAALGDRAAKERVLYIEECWASLRARGAPQSGEEALREAKLDREYGR